MTDRNSQPGAEPPKPEEMRTQRQSPVERLCAELAESWRMGRRPELRGFLERLAPDERSSGLVRLLRVELQARRERGEEASEEEYRQQYPEEAEAISLAFSTRGQTGVNTEVEVEWSVATPVPNMFEPTQIDPAQQPSRVEDESPWEPGMMLGGFRLEKMLGRGGFGEVWKGLDTRLGWDVAIKLLRPKHLNTEHQRTFFEEARKLAAMRLQGARVLEVLGANETEGWPYLVTRYLSGGTLRGQMRERPRDWQEASRVVADLAETLQMTHRQQIYHRDIKPENVLLDERGQVYLADFGLATSEDQQVREGLAIGGTWAYAAPEQCLQGISGGRTDIYALGVLFYEWLTGRCPGPSERDLHVRWLQQPTLRAQPPRELNEDVPEEVQEICLAMIEKDFDQRKITAGDVARRLRGVLAPEHTAVAALIESQKSRVSGRLVGTVGVALLGCLGAVALWSAGTGDGPDMGRGRGPDAEQGAEAGRGEPPANPPAVAGSSGERPSEPEEPLPSMARGLIQPLGQRSHLIRWKGGLELTPGLLDFPSRRPQRQFLVVPDGDTLMLQSEYPQFLPLALSLDHQLREVSWEMETDQWLGFGFFYNFRPSVGPDSAAEFAALMFFTTHPPELLPEVYAVHRQFRIDPTRGLVEDLGGQDHTRLFAERPAPQTFRIRFRFREGRLASILVNDELYAIPEGTLPMNDLVGGPLGVVLRRGHVVLSQPKLEFEP